MKAKDVGFLEDVPNTLIDKTDGSDPKKRETFWMHALEPLPPYGLNVDNDILNSVVMFGGKNFFSWLGVVWISDYRIGYWTRVSDKIMTLFRHKCRTL